MPWSRSNALMAMSSPLGADVLIPISLVAHEAISQPFHFDVVAVCQSGVIDPNKLLNNPACITVQDSGSPVRYFHGIVQSEVGVLQFANDLLQASHALFEIRLFGGLWFFCGCGIHGNPHCPLDDGPQK